jgi:hypothetical protein
MHHQRRQATPTEDINNGIERVRLTLPKARNLTYLHKKNPTSNFMWAEIVYSSVPV